MESRRRLQMLSKRPDVAVPSRCGSECWGTGLQTLAEHDRSEWIFARRWGGRGFDGSSICFYGFGLVSVAVGAT